MLFGENVDITIISEVSITLKCGMGWSYLSQGEMTAARAPL